MTTTPAKKWYQKKRFIIPLALIGLIVLGSAFGGGAKTGTPATNNSTTVATSSQTVKVENKVKLTLETFGKIKNGQTLEEVEALIGKGELSSESEIAGNTTKIYSFKGDVFSNATLTFQNDKLMSKSQFGLK
jgi:hypothetical protein